MIELAGVGDASTTTHHGSQEGTLQIGAGITARRGLQEGEPPDDQPSNVMRTAAHITGYSDRNQERIIIQCSNKRNPIGVWIVLTTYSGHFALAPDE
jgi:hypothetical protein